MDKRRRPFSRGAARPDSNSIPRGFTPREIAALLYEHPELRLGNDPAGKQLTQMLAADPQDKDLQEMFASLVENRYQQFIASGDVFWGNYPPKGGIVYPADFMALADMSTGDPTGLARSQLTGNVAFLGPTKSGKTTLLSVLLSYPELLKSARIVAFVKKHELRDLITVPRLNDRIVALKLQELALSYFEPHVGVPEPAWNNESTRLPAQCYARYSAQRLMGEKVNELMASHPDGTYPTLRQVAEVLNDFRPRFGMREASYKESILWVLTDLLNCTGRIFDYSSSDFLERLFSEPGLAIIELEDLPQEHLTFLATYFMRWLYFKRLYAGWGAPMMVIFILEDITPGVQTQRDWEAPGGLAPITECMFMGQKLEIGVVIISHTLSGLSPVIRQNVGTWMVTGLPGEDPRLVCNVLGTDLRQADKARTLQPGELVGLNPGLWPKPVYATFAKPAIPGSCSEAMRKSTAERFLKNVHTAPAAPMSVFRPPVPMGVPSTAAAVQPKTPELPARSLAFLVHVATGAPAAMTKIYDQLGLGCTQGRRVTKGLADVGLIRIHSFSTGRKGGQVCLVEITDAGWALLKKKGFLPPKRKTSGDWEHETAARLIEVEGVRLGYRVSFEVPLGGIQADVQWLDPKTGRRTLFNIGISRPAHEVEAIEKFLRLPVAGEAKFVLVARDTRFAANIKAILKGTDPAGAILRRFELKLITDFMNT